MVMPWAASASAIAPNSARFCCTKRFSCSCRFDSVARSEAVVASSSATLLRMAVTSATAPTAAEKVLHNEKRWGRTSWLCEWREVLEALRKRPLTPAMPL